MLFYIVVLSCLSAHLRWLADEGFRVVVQCLMMDSGHIIAPQSRWHPFRRVESARLIGRSLSIIRKLQHSWRGRPAKTS